MHRTECNLGAQSFVAASWNQPLLTGQVTGLGAANLDGGAASRTAAGAILSGILIGDVRAGGDATTERRTRFHPRSPYAAAKAVCALDDRQPSREFLGCTRRPGFCSITKVHCAAYRNSSRARSTDGVARIKLGVARDLQLGNLEARRDWGHARYLCAGHVADATAGQARTTM